MPYRGVSEALTDLMAGRAQFFMAPIGSSASLVREGKLRGLGVSALKRSPALPDIPTIAESGLPGFEWDAWGPHRKPYYHAAGAQGDLNPALQSAHPSS